jgi:glucan phosphoethanolaminetransferase (alkaline phosphatase superfamily)
MTNGHSRAHGVRWVLLWTGVYAAALTLGAALNTFLLAVDAFGVASTNNMSTDTGVLVEQNFVTYVPGILAVMAIPFAIALGILWLVGRRSGAVVFRILALVLFLWPAPFMLLLSASDFAFPFWLVTHIGVAATIWQPRPDPATVTA